MSKLLPNHFGTIAGEVLPVVMPGSAFLVALRCARSVRGAVLAERCSRSGLGPDGC